MERQKNPEQTDFTTELTQIVSTPLSAENINTYADNALTNLIGLIENTIEEYEARPTITYETKRDQEEAAFSYFGLQNVEAILDHIASKAEETNSLDEYIAHIPKSPKTYIPAGSGELVPGGDREESSFEKRKLPRLKTLLFILNNDYGVALDAPGQIEVTSGTNEPTMVRNLSYYSVILPQLERHILINDEVGNVTYVLNTAKYEEGELTADDILGYTKQELNELLIDNPTYGKRVIYSEYFVENLISSIESPVTVSLESTEQTTPIRSNRERPSYLLPEMPQGSVPLREAISTFGVSDKTLRRIMDELSDELGTIGEYRLKRGQIVKFLTQEQFGIVEQHMLENTQYGRRPPEGYLSNVGLAKRYDLSFQTVYKVITIMQSEGLLNPEEYLFSTTLTNGYSPHEQQDIENYLRNHEYFVGPPPEGYLSINGLRHLINNGTRGGQNVIKKVVAQLGEELGPTERYRFGQKVTDAFNPDQVAKIISVLEDTRFLTRSDERQERSAAYIKSNTAPGGYVTMAGIAKQLNLSFTTVERIVNANNDEIGETPLYKTSNSVTRYYSPDQQDIVRLKAEQLGFFNEVAPQGYVTVAELKRRWNVWERILRRILAEHKEEIGAPTIYKIGSRPEETWDEREQEILEAYVRAEGLIAPTAPAGILNQSNLAEQWGVELKMLKKAVVNAQLGAVPVFKYRNHVLPGYGNEQQSKIYGELERLGAFAPTKPDNYMTKRQLAASLSGSVKKIERIMRD